MKKQVIEKDNEVILPISNSKCIYDDNKNMWLNEEIAQIFSTIDSLSSGSITPTILNNADLNDVANIENGFFYVQGCMNSPEQTNTNGFLINLKTTRGSFQKFISNSYSYYNVYYRYAFQNEIGSQPWIKETGSNVKKDNSKYIVTFGDSMTAQTTMLSYLQNEIGQKICDVSMGGKMLSNKVAGSFPNVVDAIINSSTSELIDSVQKTKVEKAIALDWSNVDSITIFFGTNDWSNNVAIGESGNTDPTTFLGGLNYGLQKLYQNFPHISVYIIASPYRNRFMSQGDGKNADNTTNTLGLYLNDYVEALKKEAKTLYKLKVLDLLNESGINLYNCDTKTTDGLHVHGQYIARQIGNFIRNY